jgi:hypothetical protein
MSAHAGGGADRLDDIEIACAAAEIAFEFAADRFFGRIFMPLQNIGRRHDHAGGAKAALQRVVFLKRGLDRVQCARLAQSFDGQDVVAFGLRREHRAGLYGLPVHMDDAGTALAGVAADMRAGKVQTFAQKMDEKRAVFDIGADGCPVYGHTNNSHGQLSLDVRECVHKARRSVRLGEERE